MTTQNVDTHCYHPDMVAQEAGILERRMLKLKLFRQEEIAELRRSPEYSIVMRNIKYAIKSFDLGFITSKTLKIIAKEKPQSDTILVRNALTPEQWRTVLKDSSSDEYLGTILILNRYKIEQRLKKGGGGEIYLAEDNHTQRKVVVKCLPLAKNPGEREDDDGKMMERQLERESMVLSEIHHPNIVAVLDYGKENNVWYLVLEYIQGQDMQDLLMKRQAQWTLLALMEKQMRLAEAISYIHTKGLMHRDIKPANMMVDVYGTPKLVDFGLCKGGSFKTVSMPDFLLGTPYFMAPEQFRGDILDHRVDIWGWAASFYACITGDTPFQGNTQELIQEICTGKYKPIGKLAKGFPVRLERILARCMEKDKYLRYPKMEDVVKELSCLVKQKFGSDIMIPLQIQKKRFWFF